MITQGVVEMVRTITIGSEERSAIRSVLDAVINEYSARSEHDLLDAIPLAAHELPRRLRKELHAFGSHECATAVLITGSPVGSSEIGPTPARHCRPGEQRPLNAAQILQGLYADLLGEPFGFATQQHGRIFHDLLPIQGAPDNSSSGSGKIGLHTEDYSATQPFMPDYLGLMALRNEMEARTTISSIRCCSIDEEVRDILFHTRFPFCNGINQTVLFGEMSQPFLRYGTIIHEQCTDQMKRAFDALSSELVSRTLRITLQQGDALYLDNFVAVHGRDRFEPALGPNGRWFSRLCIIRDLRRIRGQVVPGTRVIKPPRPKAP